MVWMRRDPSTQSMRATRIQILKLPRIEYYPQSDSIGLVGDFIAKDLETGALVRVTPNPGERFPHLRLNLAP